MPNIFALTDIGPKTDFARVAISDLGLTSDDNAANENSAPSSAPLLSSLPALTSATGAMPAADIGGGMLDSYHFVREMTLDARTYGFGPSEFGFVSPHVQSNIGHPSPTPDLSPTQTQEVSFINGIDGGGAIVATSFKSWNNDNPATYNPTSAQVAKWGTGIAGTAGGTVSYYFTDASAWTAAEKAVFVSSLALWSDVANITFVAAASAAAASFTITRGAGGSGAFFSSTFTGPAGAGTIGGTSLFSFTGGDLNLATGDTSFGPVTADPNVAGGHVWGTIVHELGHMMGLGHGGAYNGTVAEATQQYSAQDTTLWSIMSYIDPQTATAKYFAEYPVTGTNWGVSADSFDRSPTTWMPLDILAVQALYGLPTTTGLGGGQTFGFNCNIADATKPFFDFTVNTNPVITLWDMGANNTLDLSGYAVSSNINLNAGTFSSCNGMVNNIAIAFGTVINTFVGGSGNDTVQANNNGDTITAGAGNDILIGGTGNDGFSFGASYTIGDSVNGGAGTNDQIALQGDYSGGLTLSGAQISNVEVIALLPGFDYSITTTDNLVGVGATFSEWSVSMSAGHGVTFNASADTNSNFNFFLGQGNDFATGGSGRDLFYGEGGSDTLRGNAGVDTFAYLAVSDSTSVNFDKIQDFTVGTDKFKLPVTVTGVDATVAVGVLATATFDVNMAAAINAVTLAAQHAVLFQPTGPDYAGHTFLIVDANGAAGYQAGADYVFDVTGGTLTGLSVVDFGGIPTP